jgi:hypothetical protein
MVYITPLTKKKHTYIQQHKQKMESVNDVLHALQHGLQYGLVDLSDVMRDYGIQHGLVDMKFPDIETMFGEYGIHFGIQQYDDWLRIAGYVTNEFDEYPKKILYEELGIFFTENEAKDPVRMLELDDQAIRKLGDIIRINSDHYGWVVYHLQKKGVDVLYPLGKYGYQVISAISSILLDGHVPNSNYRHQHWETGDFDMTGEGGEMERRNDFKLHNKVLTNMENPNIVTLLKENDQAIYCGTNIAMMRVFSPGPVLIERIYSNRDAVVIRLESSGETGVCALYNLRPHKH